MKRSAFGLALALGFLLLAAAAEPAGADLLVLRDGTRISTRGAWTERGALLVFTDTEGRLGSLRKTRVDVEQSVAATAAATAAAAAAAAAPPSGMTAAEPGEPILSLTEDDLTKVDDPDAIAAGLVYRGEVVLYSTSWCGWCRKTRELGVRYVEKDVERNSQAKIERNLKTGGESGVPVVDWRGQIVRGYAESTFRSLAKREREAEAKQKRASASGSRR